MAPSAEAVRLAIAGAASLRGKELKQCLEDSSFPASEIRLFDEEIVAGTLTEAGGEPAVIETVDEDSFERVRFAFFTGSPGSPCGSDGDRSEWRARGGIRGAPLDPGVGLGAGPPGRQSCPG
jgi:hypothetical protein